MNNLFVKFKADVGIDEIKSLLKSSDCVLRKDIGLVGGLVTATIIGGTVDEAVSKLAALQSVVYAEADSVMELCAETTLGIGATLFNLPAAHAINEGDSSVIVAMLDSGIDADHEDLVNNLWVDEYGTYTNGGWNFDGDDDDTSDSLGHGSDMAGIVGAEKGNSVGMYGVCPNIQLMACKVTVGATSAINSTAVVEAIDFAVDFGAKVLNMSFAGTTFQQAQYDAIDAAGDAGVLCVCSAGNNGSDIDVTPNYPAAYDLDNIVSVMAASEWGFPADIGNDGFDTAYGAIGIDVAAPCKAYTTKMDGTYWTPPSGTSQSAAYISGLSALMLSANPNLSCYDVKRLLIETATTEMTLTGAHMPNRVEDYCVADGIANAGLAIQAALDEPSNTATLGQEVIGRTVNINQISRSDGLLDADVDVLWAKSLSEYLETATQSIYIGKNIPPNGAHCDYTLDGLKKTWTEFKVLVAASTGTISITENDDGTFDYRAVLTSAEDGSLYSLTTRGDGSIFGTYFISGSKSDCEAVFETVLFNDITGVIGSGSTLQATVVGRTVSQPSISFDKTDGVYRYVINILWEHGQTSFSEPFGTHDVETVVKTYFSQGSLPLAAALVGSYDETDGVTATSRRLTGPTGTGVYRQNDDGTFDYAIVERTVTVSKRAGITGLVTGLDWHIFGFGYDTERNVTRQSVSYQQIQRRIGGELEFREDDDGNLCGIRWNTNFDLIDGNGGREYGDTTEPDAWTDLGYKRKYGEWHTDWEKSLIVDDTGIAGKIYEGSVDGLESGVSFTLGDYVFCNESGKFHGLIVVRTSNTTSESPTPGVVYEKLADGKIYVGIAYSGSAQSFTNTTYWTEVTGVVSVGLFEGIDPKDLEDSVRDEYEDTTSTSEYATIGMKWHNTSTDKYYICIAYNVMSKNFTDTLYWTEIPSENIRMGQPGYIAVRGVGAYPEEKRDLYIPILQELEREVRWDNAFDADREYGDTAAPAAWAADGYEATYGDWDTGWEKSFVIGGVGVSGHTYLGAVDHSTDSATMVNGNVWYANDTGKFYGPIIVRTSDTTGETPSATGLVYHALLTGKLYVCIATYGSSRTFLSTSYWTEITGLMQLGLFEAIDPTDIAFCIRDAYENTTSTSQIPLVGMKWHNTSTNKYYIAIADAALTPKNFTDTLYWTEVDVNNIQTGLAGYIGQKGVGTYPEEELAKVGVIDGSGGYALSSSARVSFYVSACENPRMCEIIEATKRGVVTINLYTYFAVNPHWLAEASRRIPSDWANLAAVKTSATNYISSTTSTSKAMVPVGFNNANSNFSIDHQIVKIDDDVFAVRKTIVLREEWSADEESLQAFIDMMPANSTGGITGHKMLMYHDLSALAITPWSGSFKDAG